MHEELQPGLQSAETSLHNMTRPVSHVFSSIKSCFLCLEIESWSARENKKDGKSGTGPSLQKSVNHQTGVSASFRKNCLQGLWNSILFCHLIFAIIFDLHFKIESTCPNISMKMHAQFKK